MKFTQIPENTFKEMQLNAGVLMKTFNPSSATVSGIMAATTGGIKFEAKPTYKDMGENVDNCPKNTKELKKLDTWEVKLTGTMATINALNVKNLLGAADALSEKITPRGDLKDEDFSDIWWVGDYSDKNGSQNGGFCAIHMMSVLSTGGFSLQTADKDNGQFPFEYMAHYSVADQDKVPFEVYVKAGTPEAA